jgi:D-serine dehydratase
MSRSSTLTALQAAALMQREPLLWLNPGRRQDARDAIDSKPFLDAQDRLRRASRLLASLFPEAGIGGTGVESPLLAVPRLRRGLGMSSADGELLLKADHQLPIAGSIKARGGFHEVLAHAEAVALRAGFLHPGNDLAALASPAARALFSKRRIAVGSTGNLGLSIGTLAAALGFEAIVHMSCDAKLWKKQELRRRGARVVEHAGDYLRAVAAGREQAAECPDTYFVDDESSTLLLEGYAAAAWRLADQLAALGRTPSPQQPLFVYLPCGVGGAPGGIALGLTSLFGPDVHCFFAEPVASPCMLLKMASGSPEPVSVYDYGLDNRTEADGLAVPRASELVAARIQGVLSGVFTVTDRQLFSGLHQAWKCEGIEIEPSAAAGFEGPHWVLSSEAGKSYLQANGLEPHLATATHVLWSTGGSLVPVEDHQHFRKQAERMLTTVIDSR